MAVAFRRRFFLNPESAGHSSHILAEVESSHKGKYLWGSNFIRIADCRRSIELEFDLGNPASRKQSIDKLDLLIRVLGQFREALQKEITLIERSTKIILRPPN
jgi:hypothetical protein